MAIFASNRQKKAFLMSAGQQSREKGHRCVIAAVDYQLEVKAQDFYDDIRTVRKYVQRRNTTLFLWVRCSEQRGKVSYLLKHVSHTPILL